MLFRYILRRVLIFIPTLFAISLLAFVISINAPGDPVEARFRNESSGKGSAANQLTEEAAKDSLRDQLGLNLPVFYLTLTSLAEPDTFYRIADKAERENLARLTDRFGNWTAIQSYYRSLHALKNAAAYVLLPDSAMLTSAFADSIRLHNDNYYQRVLSLLRTNDPVEIRSKLDALSNEQARLSATGFNYLAPSASALNTAVAQFDALEEHATPWKNYVPALHWYRYNQYHRWLFGDGNMLTGSGARNTRGIVRGDFGVSYVTWKPVTETIARALPWSLFFTVMSVFLAYLISIPIGVHAAMKRGTFFDRSSSIVLFMLYSLPTFLMGTLLLMLFANPDAWNIFPANGVKPATGYPEGAGLWEKFMISWPYFVLPLICYTYSSLAFLSRTMRVAVLEISSSDFMRTARAKGLSDYLVMYRHGLRNALLPIITVFANVFPLAVGGSVILEYLFGIPGMGPEILTAVQTKDFQMIVAVFTLSGFMTLIGYLVADILYAIADPRISFSKR
jgi:peptide/nickel transport system permease protein